MSAVGLYRGPGHVLIYANEELVAMSGSDGVGIPIRERELDSGYDSVIKAMDRVFQTGEVLRVPASVHHFRGTLSLRPRRVRGRTIGVVCLFRASLALLEQSPVAPREAVA